jgi:hypothetical protein
MKWTGTLLVLTLAMAACEGKTPTTPGTPATPDPPAPSPLVVLDPSGQLASGFDIFVNTDRGRTDWLNPDADGMKAAYPSGQAWGFVGLVLQGPTAFGSRPSRDLSKYKTLQVQLRGQDGGESIAIGLKDSNQPDTGTETKKVVALTTSWQTLSFPLSDFKPADLTRLYLVFEIVFSGTPGQTVYFRDIRYVP